MRKWKEIETWLFMKWYKLDYCEECNTMVYKGTRLCNICDAY